MLKVIETDNGGHYYMHGDRRIPGVSEILELSGMYDSGGASEAVLENAARRGKELHLAAQDLDRGSADWWSEDAELRGYMDGYQLFKSDFGFKPELIEEPMSDTVSWYAGQLDRTGTILAHDRRLDLVTLDLKFTCAMPDHVGVQLAAYNGFFHDDKPRQRVAVRPKKNGKYEVQWCDEIASGYHDTCVWLACLAVAKWKDKKKGLGLWLPAKA